MKSQIDYYTSKQRWTICRSPQRRTPQEKEVMSKRTNRRPSVLPSKSMTMRQLQRYEAYLLDARKVIVFHENASGDPKQQMTRADVARAKKDRMEKVGCFDCKCKNGSFDYDHRPGTTKLFQLGNCRRRSLKEIYQEYHKCDLVCVPCHKKRTKKRGFSKERKAQISKTLTGRRRSACAA